MAFTGQVLGRLAIRLFHVKKDGLGCSVAQIECINLSGKGPKLFIGDYPL